MHLMTLSLLLNEVVTNSVKHAFERGKRGTISVRLEQETKERFLLSVQDDGPGLAKDSSKGLGFGIMQNLAAQLGGKISVSGQQGMTMRVVFPAHA